MYTLSGISFGTIFIGIFVRLKYLQMQSRSLKAGALSVIVKKLLRDDKNVGRPCPIEYIRDELVDILADGTWLNYLSSENQPSSEVSSGTSDVASTIAEMIRGDSNSGLAIGVLTVRNQVVSLWPLVQQIVNLDSRIQTNDMLQNGSTKKCWRFMSGQTPFKM